MASGKLCGSKEIIITELEMIVSTEWYEGAKQSRYLTLVYVTRKPGVSVF